MNIPEVSTPKQPEKRYRRIADGDQQAGHEHDSSLTLYALYDTGNCEPHEDVDDQGGIAAMIAAIEGVTSNANTAISGATIATALDPQTREEP